MPYEYQCPDPNCEFTVQENDQNVVVESAQQHQRDKHDDIAKREEVVESIVGT